MSTFRDTVSWIVALLGAVAIYEAFGVVSLFAWTIGVMAFVHSRDWNGPFPTEGPAPDERAHLAPLRHQNCVEHGDRDGTAP